MIEMVEICKYFDENKQNQPQYVFLAFRKESSKVTDLSSACLSSSYHCNQVISFLSHLFIFNLNDGLLLIFERSLPAKQLIRNKRLEWKSHEEVSISLSFNL